MEKAAAFPLWAGLMPNSPMSMLDVGDWLMLMTVSTTGGGGRVPPFLFCGIFLLAAGCCPFAILVLSYVIKIHCQMSALSHGCWCGGVVLCCVLCRCWPASSAVLNQHSLVCVVYKCTYFISGARPPDSIRMDSSDDVQTCKCRAQ
jgi:hypothetical protein